jgi:hypothetical protein
MIEHTRAMHTPRAVMTMPPSWLVDGFVAAVGRAKAADDADEDTARGISIAVAEALMWLDALRQTKRDVGRGRVEVVDLADDPLVKALVFVRGRIHHHWAPVAARYDGRTWGWLSADNLPLPPGPEFANPKGERLYRELLEHRPVLDALTELARRLESVERP